jgi:hypothetical protein
VKRSSEPDLHCSRIFLGEIEIDPLRRIEVRKVSKTSPEMSFYRSTDQIRVTSSLVGSSRSVIVLLNLYEEAPVGG